MCSTITTGKKSAAFVRADGTVIYVLFESTYEANVFPHTPHCGCIAIGVYADVMKKVFAQASACECGSLQGTGGRNILPENYIAAWKRELSAPTRMTDVRITLKVGKSYLAPILEDKLDEVRQALVQIGRENVFNDIKAGQAVMYLHEDEDVVLALYGVDKLFAPWKILHIGDSTSNPALVFAPKAVIGKFDPPTTRVYRLYEDEVLGHFGAAPYRYLGAEYLAVEKYINSVAYPLEIQQTGCAKRLIAEYREQCRNAPPVPPSTMVTINREVAGIDKWNVDCADQLAQKLGIIGEGQPAPTTFQCAFAEVIAKDAIYPFKYLRPEQLQWDVPETVKWSFPQQTQQLELLAAA